MGQLRNKVLNTYPSLTFSPSLESTFPIAQLTCIPEKPRLRWQATLGREDYDKLSSENIEVQVWSNCTGEKWSANTFRQCTTLNASDEEAEPVDLSLLESNTETNDNQVYLEASIPVPSSVGHTAVEFTYRLVYASERIDWLGTNETNGRIVVSSVEEDGCPKAENWINECNDAAFLWTCIAREPTVIAKLSSDIKWNGWAFKEDNTGSSDISRFIGVTSESVTGPVFALALLPQNNRGTCVVYSPVLYTAQHGTLSLEGNNVLLHPGEGEPTKLNAYTLTSTWKDYMPQGSALLDIHSSDFLAVSRNNPVDVSHLHFLPVTGAQSVISLGSSDLISLVPSSLVLLIDPNFRAIKFLREFSPTERLRVAVGPVGGEISIVPAYSLSASISVAFLRDQGSITELKVNCYLSKHPSFSSPEFTSDSSNLNADSVGASPPTVVQMRPEGQSSKLPALLLLVVHMFQYFRKYFFSIISPRSSSVSVSERIAHGVCNSQDTSMSPRLAFEVTGKSSLLVDGEDASKLRILVDGTLLQTTPKDIGRGHWLIENTSQVDNDHRRRRIEILLQM